jgi:hypothetical protein
MATTPAVISKQNIYTRRSPAGTPLYRVVRRHLRTFLAAREAEGRPLPKFVVDEFEAYLRCGIHAYGFLRVQCDSCDEEWAVAFSCKKRGFCPSCAAKRKAETAAHMIEQVLPFVPYRQFVLSFPIPLRFWLHTNTKLFARVHAIVIRAIHRFYTSEAEWLGVSSPAPGSISFLQRWGSAANLNPHLHILCPDGVYERHDGQVRFRNIEPLTNDDVTGLVETISHDVVRYLRRKGYLDKAGEIVEHPAAEGLFAEHDAMAQAVSSSLAGKIAFGPNAGHYVTRIGSGFGYSEEVPKLKGRLCASINGFSLHAATRVNTHARERLAGLIEYIARGPLSNERVEMTQEGNVKLRLKTKWEDGTTHLLFTPGEFLEKLAALVPPPKRHLVRWGGVFAPNSPYRKEITLKPHVKKGFQSEVAACADDQDSANDTRSKNRSWSKMLARVFKVDVTKCPACGGEMTIVCAVTESRSIKRYLERVGIDPHPPARGPPEEAAELVQGAFDFGGSAEDCPN